MNIEQEADALEALISDYLKARRVSYSPVEKASTSQSAELLERAMPLIRALNERVKKYGLCGLEDKPHELKPDACVGWLSYHEVEQMQTKIESLEADLKRAEDRIDAWHKKFDNAQDQVESLEAERDLVIEMYGYLTADGKYFVRKWPAPSEIAARVVQNQKERGK